MIKDNYYQLLDFRREENHAVFRVRLLADCKVYEGHFPGHPISPGVCNMAMIKECATLVTACPLRIREVKRCRLTAVMSPSLCADLCVTIDVLLLDNESYSVKATIADTAKVYVKFKGEMVRGE